MATNRRVETFNPELLKKVIELFDYLYPHLSAKEAKKMKKTCERYLKKSRGGRITVEYEPAENKPPGVGRLYAKGGVGLQFLPKRIRHTIAGKYYWDVDMKNAHPTILLTYCGMNNIPHKHLKAYVENREDKLNDLMHCLDMDREEAKCHVLKFVNATGKASEASPKWFKEMVRELHDIRKAVCELNPEYMVYADNTKGNEQGSLTNLVHQRERVFEAPRRFSGI